MKIGICIEPTSLRLSLKDRLASLSPDASITSMASVSELVSLKQDDEPEVLFLGLQDDLLESISLIERVRGKLQDSVIIGVVSKLPDSNERKRLSRAGTGAFLIADAFDEELPRLLFWLQEASKMARLSKEAREARVLLEMAGTAMESMAPEDFLNSILPELKKKTGADAIFARFWRSGEPRVEVRAIHGSSNILSADKIIASDLFSEAMKQGGYLELEDASMDSRLAGLDQGPDFAVVLSSCTAEAREKIAGAVLLEASTYDRKERAVIQKEVKGQAEFLTDFNCMLVLGFQSRRIFNFTEKISPEKLLLFLQLSVIPLMRVKHEKRVKEAFAKFSLFSSRASRARNLEEFEEMLLAELVSTFEASVLGLIPNPSVRKIRLALPEDSRREKFKENIRELIEKEQLMPSGFEIVETNILEHSDIQDSDEPVHFIKFRGEQDLFQGIVVAGGILAGISEDELGVLSNIICALIERAKIAENENLAKETVADLLRALPVSRLFSGIRHEINNQLTVIKSATELIEMKAGEMLSRPLSHIMTAISNCENTLKDSTACIIPCFRRENKVVLSEVINRIFFFLEERLRKHGIDALLMLDTKKTFEGSECHYIELAFFYLILKAIDSLMNKGGRLTVRAFDNDTVTSVEIFDDGCGIESGEIAFSLEARALTRGVHMDVFVAKMLLEKFNAKIELETHEPAGKTVKILFKNTGERKN